MSLRLILKKKSHYSKMMKYFYACLCNVHVTFARFSCRPNLVKTWCGGNFLSRKNLVFLKGTLLSKYGFKPHLNEVERIWSSSTSSIFLVWIFRAVHYCQFRNHNLLNFCSCIYILPLYCSQNIRKVSEMCLIYLFISTTKCYNKFY